MQLAYPLAPVVVVITLREKSEGAFSSSLVGGAKISMLQYSIIYLII